MAHPEGKDMISLYIPDSVIKEGYHYSVLLYPFWGIQRRGSMVFAERMFTQYAFNTDCYTLSENPESADYVLLPYNYWFLKKYDPDLIDQYVELAEKLHKPLLIDSVSDKFDQIAISHSVVLRYSSYRKWMKENDIIIPVYSEDLLLSHRSGVFLSKKKGNIASIGFDGWSSLPFFKYYRTYIKDFPLFLLGIFTKRFDMYRKGAILRQNALRTLKKSKKVKLNLAARVSFSGNKKTAERDPEILRKEFVENILESDYTLCIRGDANQSTRFFETLSLGRVPIFVDTDIPLPLEDIIDYRSFCVFVDYKDIKRIDEIVAEFHKGVSEEDFEIMQRKAREAYETYLRIDAYTPFLMEELKKRIDARA